MQVRDVTHAMLTRMFYNLIISVLQLYISVACAYVLLHFCTDPVDRP